MTTATTAYRDYVMNEFADSLHGDEFDDLEMPTRKPAVRTRNGNLRVRSSQPTTVQRYFVVQFDADSRSWTGLPPILTEPESELAIFVPHRPKKTRQVLVRITRRSKGVPNPILPIFGE